MAKQSSKASSPSWRTLRRQAAYAVSEAHKEKLLKESNRLRRAERAKAKAKAGPKKPTRKMVHAVKKLIAATPTVLAQGGPMVQTQGWSPLPTHDELLAQSRAEEITKLARSKTGTQDEISRRLACWNRIAELNGRKDAEESHAAVVQNLLKQQGINTVASFLCAANGAAKANGGPLPRSMVVSGYVLAKVVDALTQAGYTEDGFKSDGIRRPDRNQVVEDMIGNRLNRPR